MSTSGWLLLAPGSRFSELQNPKPEYRCNDGFFLLLASCFWLLYMENFACRIYPLDKGVVTHCTKAGGIPWLDPAMPRPGPERACLAAIFFHGAPGWL
jgi:hypothetical protein